MKDLFIFLLCVFLSTVMIVATVAFVYGVVVRIIMNFFKCDKEDAESYIAAFLTGGWKYDVSQDPLFLLEVEDIAKIVLGDVKYEELVKLAKHTPLIWGSSDGFSCICIMLPNLDNDEMRRAEALLSRALERFLMQHNRFPKILVDWKEHPTLKMKYIMLRYARTVYEHQFIKNCIRQNTEDSMRKFQPVVDEEVENAI